MTATNCVIMAFLLGRNDTGNPSATGHAARVSLAAPLPFSCTATWNPGHGCK